MMEIVHDLAPGAQLYFAGTRRGRPPPKRVRRDILALRNTYGCDIIVDTSRSWKKALSRTGDREP
jgi:hypothetical protein